MVIINPGLVFTECRFYFFFLFAFLCALAKRLAQTAVYAVGNRPFQIAVCAVGVADVSVIYSVPFQK